MAIVTSTVVEDRAQVDGRRHVTEHHTDHLGFVYPVRYVALAGDDVAAVLAARVPVLNQWLIDRELQQDIQAILEGRYDDVTAEFAPLADIRAALRAFYQTASGQDVGRMAGYLLTLTDAQLRTIFNMTQAQVTTLRTRLQARADALAAVLTATGE